MNKKTWIGALLALFMVFVLPACWSGALIRAAALGTQGPSNSNNNEEREEHEERELDARDGEHHRPPPPPARREARIATAPVVTTTSTIVASVAHPREPSVLSVRRLL